MILTLTCLSASHFAFSQIYLGSSGDVAFFSKSPIEDIEAHNSAVKPVLNSTTGDILYKIPIINFEFKSALMQEHFNENYMESDKYPMATFEGKINEEVDFSKNLTTSVTTTGTINIHGVAKPFTASGTVTVKGKDVILNSAFKVHLSDFNIVVPALYANNIPPDIDVTLFHILSPYSKK